jgi:hypothetical protein
MPTKSTAQTFDVAGAWMGAFSTNGRINEYLESDAMGLEETALRRNTYTGRPTGSPQFVAWAESQLGRSLTAHPGGRPKKAAVAQVGLFED